MAREHDSLMMVRDIRHAIVLKLHEELDNGGIHGADTAEVGQAVDMIKDLYCAEKDAWKSCWYKMQIEEGMPPESDPDDDDDAGPTPESDEEEEWPCGVSGYNHRRYGSGRYASKGHGHYVRGYMPMPMDPKKYKDMFNDPMTNVMLPMGYTGGKHGEAFESFVVSKHQFGETANVTDKDKMNMHAGEAFADDMYTIKELWKSATPELKKQMKMEITKLAGEMTI